MHGAGPGAPRGTPYRRECACLARRGAVCPRATDPRATSGATPRTVHPNPTSSTTRVHPRGRGRDCTPASVSHSPPAPRWRCPPRQPSGARHSCASPREPRTRTPRRRRAPAAARDPRHRRGERARPGGDHRGDDSATRGWNDSRGARVARGTRHAEREGGEPEDANVLARIATLRMTRTVAVRNARVAMTIHILGLSFVRVVGCTMTSRRRRRART